MRRLELTAALAFLSTALAAQSMPVTGRPRKNARAGAEVPQDKTRDEEKGADVNRLTREIKELSDQARAQMKEIAKDSVSQRQKLEQELDKTRQEMEKARAEMSRQEEGEDRSEREARVRDGAEQYRDLQKRQRDLDSQLRARNQDANNRAQETLRSMSFQYEKLLSKLRPLGDAKAIEDATSEHNRAQEEARRILKEVIGRGEEAPRPSTPRIATGATQQPAVAVPPQAGFGGRGQAARPGAPGGGAFQPGVPQPAGAMPPGLGRPGGLGGPAGALSLPAAPEQDADKAREMKARLEEHLAGIRAAQQGVFVGAAQAAEPPDPAEVTRLRSEIKELRNEIKGLRELLQSIVKETEKRNGKKDEAPDGARQDPAGTPPPDAAVPRRGSRAK